MMLDIDEKQVLRKYYIRTIERLGWKVAYDANKNFKSELLDVNMMLIRKKKNKEGVMETSYGFLQVPYTSACSYEKFREQRLHPEDGEFAKLVNYLDSLIYPYDLDDVVCQLLHLGYHITDVYTIQNGALHLKLTPSIIKNMIDEFIRKGSPLINNELAHRPHRIKDRAPIKTFLNVDIFGKNGRGLGNIDDM